MKEEIEISDQGSGFSDERRRDTECPPDPAFLIPGPCITRSAEETFELARRIGERLSAGAIFLLSGDLGAGKTVFAKGIAAGLDIDPAYVTSPTFTLVNLYEGRLKLYHVDLYRLDEGACLELGLDEILEAENSVTIIEWAERLRFMPSGAIRVEIDYVSDAERKITIRKSG